MDHFQVEIEFKDNLVTLTLPPCLPLEAVLDLGEYLIPPMRIFRPMVRPGNRIGFVLPQVPTQIQQEKFVTLLQGHTGLWFKCYPCCIEAKKKDMIKQRKHLRVVENSF